MADKTYLSHDDLRARWLAATDIEWFHARGRETGAGSRAGLKIYGVPRGGYVAGLFVCAAPGASAAMVADPHEADIILDDIVDSGATRSRYNEAHPDKPFVALVDKTRDDAGLGWVVFPWEVMESGADEGAEENVVRLLQFIGEDPSREGLRDTPARFVRALAELTSGLREDPTAHLSKSFPIEDADAGVGTYDQIILSRDVPFVSLCEHHLLPFDGVAHIAYLPDPGGKRIVGLSKLARCLDGYARRPQVQERLTMQVANAIQGALDPAGVAVVIKARHTCQCFRGVRKDGRMVTSSMAGVFREDAKAREEMLRLITL